MSSKNVLTVCLNWCRIFRQKKTQKDVGTIQQILVEEQNQHDANLMTGRTGRNYLVHFPGSKDLIGQLVSVRLTESKGFYYMGERIEA